MGFPLVERGHWHIPTDPSPRMDTLCVLGRGLRTGFSMGIFSAGVEVLRDVKGVFLWVRS